MRKLTLVALLVSVSGSEVAAQQMSQNPKAFECGFIYDKFKGGKSGEASCSYMGEKVFSTANDPFPANEHCKTEPVFGFTDLKNFQIDLPTKKLTWDAQGGLASFAEAEMIDYYMKKEKISREEATKRATTKQPIVHYAFTISHAQRIYDTIYIDEINRTPLNPPKNIPADLITFGEPGSNYSIYISENSGNAILSEYVSDNDGTWVNLRFGKCRILGTQ
jgi:hypothetical protein